jgi:DNA polymerase III epsilon subunit-like protein
MDEIDVAIAEFEAKKAAKDAKKKQKKRPNPTDGHEVSEVADTVVSSEAQAKELRSNPPATKKQKLSKKGQFKAFKGIYGRELHPSIKLCLNNLKGDDKYLGMKDIHQLMVSIVGIGPAVNWADIAHQSRIAHVYLIVLDSLSHDLFLEASVSGHMPFLTSHFLSAPAKAPGNAKRVFDGVSVLLRHPMSKSVAKTMKRAHESTLAGLSTLSSVPSEASGDQTSETFEIPASTAIVPSQGFFGPSITKEELQERLSESKTLALKSLHTAITELTPGQLLLTHRELEANLYPLPHTITEEGFLEIAKYKESEQNGGGQAPEYHLLAIDCEMCRTSVGIELTRVVVINTNLEVVYDSYVKPRAPITDYLTRYSGITKEILDPVTISLSDVQRDLLTFITPKTILIGHSLENDLKALKLSHQRVIDTALLYPHTRGETFKNSLKFLAENWLRESIQNEHGHDPTQDAITAMKLTLLKLKNGANFGRVALGDKEENFCEYLYRQGKRTSIIDNLHGCKNYSGSHTDVQAEESDDNIVSKSQRAFASCQYEFAYCRLRSLERYYASLETHIDTKPAPSIPTPNPENSASIDQNALSNLDAPAKPIDHQTEMTICAKFDEQLQHLLSNIPKKALVIVTGGHGNLARVRAINNIRQKAVNSGATWSEADDAKSRLAFEKARETIVFFHIPPESDTSPATSSASNDTKQAKATNSMDVTEEEVKPQPQEQLNETRN